jgi:DNA-binding transcriptional MerR regulator
MTAESQELTLAELAEQSGVPGRTIRFYIARGLLPGPGKAGRGATYGRAHRERLREIGGLQAKGLTLMEITRRLAGEGVRSASVEPTAWWQYPVADDVVVNVRADASPWRLKQIRTYLAQMASGLRDNERKE